MIAIRNVLDVIRIKIGIILSNHHILALDYEKKLCLDKIESKLYWDLSKFMERDPAAKDIYTVMSCSTGFRAIMYYRIANAVLKIEAKSDYERKYFYRVAYKISEDAKVKTGIDINPSAEIRPGFVIDHGMGVVIGETVIIGKNCYFLQGVVLGSRGVADNSQGKRHPTIGNNVELAGEVKVYGNILIGDDVFIGANNSITEDIPEGKRIIKYRKPDNVIDYNYSSTILDNQNSVSVLPVNKVLSTMNI